MKTFFVLGIVFWHLIVVMPGKAYAQISGISYPERTRPYSGWTAIVKGDNNTRGMAGATVALPNNIAAMENNPAGFAMTLGGFAAQLNSNTFNDPELNRSVNSLTEYQWGVGSSMPPWGFGITYYSPSSEQVANSEVSVRQLDATAAHLIGKRMSVGLAIQLNKGIRTFDGNDLSGTHVSFQLGALYKLENHWILGASYSPASTIGPSDNTSVQSFGFDQPILIPSLMELGVGFVPNRFFKAGFSIIGVTGTPNTALLYDQTISYGQNFTLQPRIGASYVLAEYSFLKVELATGSYFEVSRVDGLQNRMHATFGLDVNPWFINTGLGADLAANYSSWLVSIGVDIVRTARILGIIPKDSVSPYEGILPPALKQSADGLAEGFTLGEKKTEAPLNANEVKKIIEDVPTRVEEKLGIIKTKPKKRRKKIKPAYRSFPLQKE